MSAALQWIVNAEPPFGVGPSQPFDVGLLPSSVSQAIWRGTEVGQSGKAVVSTGFEALDAQLPGGGWPCNSLTELLQSQPSLCEWRLLSPALARLVTTGGQILLVGPPKRPHVPGLVKLGIAEKIWSGLLLTPRQNVFGPQNSWSKPTRGVAPSWRGCPRRVPSKFGVFKSTPNPATARCSCFDLRQSNWTLHRHHCVSWPRSVPIGSCRFIF